MSANLRAVLAAIAGFAAVLLAIWGVNQGIVQPAFVKLEQAQALEDGARARAAIEGELRQLDQKLSDWAAWDDAYAFVDSRNPAFVQSNLGNWRVLEKDTHLNLCMVLDRDGQVLYSGGYDSDLGGAVLPAAFAGDPPAIWPSLRPVLEWQQTRSGLLLTEHGLLLLAARPILTTQGTGPARGLLVFGRFLDKALLRMLAEQTQVAFELLPAGDPRLTPAERAYLATSRASAPELRPGPAGTGFVYEVLPDLTGQPAALLRTPIRQAISATARQTSRALVSVLGLAALALLLGQSVWSNRLRRDGPRSATAWSVATLAALIGLTLSAGLAWEFHRQGLLAPRDFQVLLAGGVITLLLAWYLFALIAQRQRAERLAAARTAELQASEERYRVAALMTGQMIYDYDCASGQIQWAGAISTITGYPTEKFAAVDIDAWAALIHPDDRPDALDRLNQAMASGATYNVEYRLQRKEGSYRWIEDYGAFLLNSKGEVYRMLGAMKDVTERKQVAAALEAREAQLRTLIDAMPDIVCFKDGAGRWLEANAFTVRLFGLEGVDYRGKTDMELTEYRPSCRAAHRQCEETDELAWQRGEPTRSDEHIPQSDGTEHIFDVIKIPRFDHQGRRHSLVVVGRDVTDRHRAEQQLRQSEEKFAKIFLTTPDVVIISRLRDGLLLDVNPGFEAVTGYSRTEAVGRSSLDLELWADPADRERMVSDLRLYGQVLYRDFSFRRKDGAVRAGHYSARPLAIDHESCLLFVMQDVTERRRAEAELRQHDRVLWATADTLALLLSGRDLGETIGAALATLGRAVGVDRAYIFENHADPATGVLLASQRYEWCAEGATPQIDNPELQNMPYDVFPGWDATLTNGVAIKSLVRELPEAVRAMMEPQAIRSLLLLPIQIDDRFWGFIGFDDCHTDRIWSPVEETMLRTAAVALGHTHVRLRAEAALRANERRFRAMIEHAPDGIVLFNETIRYASPAVKRLLGYTPEEALALDPDRLTHPEDLPPLLSLLNDLLGQPGHVVTTQYRFRHKDGSWRWLESTISNLLAEPSMGALVFNFRDITERWQAEGRQRLAAVVFEAAREAIFVADAETRILAVNPAFTVLTGYAEATVRGRSPRLLWADRQPEAYFEAMERTAAREGVWQGEFWARRRDGERRAALASLCAVRDASGRILHYVGIATDVTDQKAAERRIERLAYYDSLTDLPNRTLLAQRAAMALALAARHRNSLAVLFFDLDRFKEVNDALGHAAGDALLAQVAARLQALVRVEDTVCRLGGDEFVLLLPEADQEGALRVADKALAAFRQPFAVAGHDLSATASVGIALYPHDGADFAELLKNADAAMYRAKHTGRNTRVFYDRAMNAATLARMVLEAELRQAIAAGQLRAYYQPKVRLSDGTLVGAEALVRWEHPDRGLIPPGQFIPVAEASDLIVALGDWMLVEVCRQLAAWRRQGGSPLTVAVNLAARHFRQPGLTDRIRGLLDAHDLPAQALELELTESTLLDANADTIETLRQLERLGLGLALDDFGTGYSSLSYLKRLPLTALKIDQGFVRDLVANPDDRAIAATIVALGHHLELAVVAEGVETEDQRRLLLEQGCDLAQGYLFSRPLPAEAFATAWLTPARA
ncbi:MAG: PAS domain S-box protein [Candidatus Contendobacter sp.]|nr:PAS domain S-box protein [Candidatus Contendobacter sp.]